MATHAKRVSMGTKPYSVRSPRSFLPVLFLFCSCVQVIAADVSLVWDASVSSNVSGYNVYVGSSSGAYNTPITIGNQITYTVTGLGNGTWYFALTAFDADGNESDYSNEVSLTIATAANLSLNTGGSAVFSTAGLNGTTQAGYVTLAVNSGAAPYGTVVFSYKQNGVTVSETGVPASPPTTRARIFIECRNAVNPVPGRSGAGTVNINTGIAIVNHSSDTAKVAYTLRDFNGDTLSSGNGTIPAGAHFAKFIDQISDVASGFSLPADFQNTIQFASLEISSDRPLSILALRQTTNQRNEALFTTTPIADLTQPIRYDPMYFPQFVDGDGYTTSLLLLNTSSGIESGTLQILDNNGVPLIVTQAGGTEDSSFRYWIPSGGVFRFQTSGFPTTTNVGWVRLTPDAGTPAPIGEGVFGYNPGDILITESAIPATVSTTHARVYVDLSGDHNAGLAIANVDSTAASITINAFQTDGATGIGTNHGPLQLAGGGHDAQFADQLITGLPAGFTGVLDIISTTPFVAFTIRSLINERGDPLMTAFPIADANRAAPSPIVFPQIADQGGSVTEFILLSVNDRSSTTLNFYGDNGSPLTLYFRH
jgi:hypothetical protein